MTIKRPGENTGKQGGVFQEVGPKGGKQPNYTTVPDNRPLPPTTKPGRMADRPRMFSRGGDRGSLRLLASVPALAVPESVVPSAERLDLDAVFELNRKAEQGARMLVLMQSPEPDASPRTPWEQLPDEP